MTLTRLKIIAAMSCVIAFSGTVSAQGFSFNCARDTLIPGCPSATCITLKTLIPDPHRASNSYAVGGTGQLPSCLLASANPGIPGQPTTLSLDDRYSPVFPIGFPFVFFGTAYNDLVVSSNGYISFNTALTGTFSHWNIINGGVPQDLPSTFYDGAVIMGPYHDIDVAITTSPSRLISYQTAGLAPYRKWILNYYKIPLFSAACNPLIENTHQIILYESTGIIDVNIFDMQICPGWNQGRAMVGVQDITRTLSKMAPGRAASDPPWGSVGMNESIRFIPTGGTPIFRRVELYDLAGTLISTGTTTVLPTGDRDVSFPNICPPAGASTSYVIKAFYDKIDDPATEIYATDTIRVNRTQGVVATPVATPADCGVPNGTVNITSASGGTAPYEYSLDGITWQSGTTFSSLSAGAYIVHVRDASGLCTGTFNITVGVIGNLSAVTSNTATACSGINNGTITITSVTGTAPYTFSLDGAPYVAGTLPYTITGLASGIHTVVVRDINTCVTNTISVNITNGTGVTATTSATATSCPGATNGTITVNTTAGTAPFTYQLGAGAPQASNVFTGLAGGTYSILVTDANGCTRTVTRTVNNGTAVTATTAVTAASCSGASNGSVTVTPTNGTGPYTFVLDGVTTQTGATNTTFTGLTPGSHTIVITDNPTGCLSNTININIATGVVIAANAVPAATSCNGAANGSITVTPTTGTAPYSYSLDGAAPVPGTVPYTFSSLTSGAHTIRVTDANGCQTNVINVNIAVGPQLAANAVPAATSCNGAANGSITVTPTNGNAPYTFSLDGGAPLSGGVPYTFSSLTSGAHTIRVTDVNGCQTNVINVNIAVGPQLAANAAPSATSCNGAANGSITVTPTNGNAPYSFALDAGAPVTAPAPYTFTGVSAGPHTIIVTDANGCVTNTINADVAVGPTLTTSVSKTDVLCAAGLTGSITVATPSIGTAPYEYSLDNVTWQSSNIFNGLAAGSYTVYYRESNGCVGSQQINISEPPVLDATAAAVPVVCNGESNGIITITSTGGVAPHEFSIDGGATWQSSNIFNVPAGTYTIITRDANGCTNPRTINVSEPAVLSAVEANTNASCDGGNDGTITVTAAGGNSGYQYSIDGGANWQSSNIFNVAPGTYNLLVKDALGCTFPLTSTVGLSNNLTFVAQMDPTICESKSTPLELVSNATQYAWSPATGLSSTTVYNPVANPVVTTTYTVIATLGRCTATDIVTVNVNPAPIPDAGSDGYICYGQTYPLSASGGTTYLWTPSTYLDNPNIANPISTPAKDITYTVTILSDVNGCASLVTDQMRIDVTPPVKVNTFPYDTVAYPGDRIQLMAIPSDPDATIYTWSPATGLSNPDIKNPIVTVGPIGSDITYRVITSTIAGCKGEGFVHIKVYTGPDIYVPTGFTPNGDGRNDRFIPFPVGVKSLNYFRVFNRWGQLVFSTSKLHDGWDGKLGGTDQPSGTYVWMAEGVTAGGKLITKKGVVTLIR